MMENSVSTPKLIDAFLYNYGLAYDLIEKALNFDESSNYGEALIFYKDGLVILGKTFAFDLEKFEDPDDRILAQDLITKMKVTRQETLDRIHFLESNNLSQNTEKYELNNSDSANSPEYGSTDYYYSENSTNAINSQELPNAELLLAINKGVQLFFIDDHNNVTSPEGPSPLKIFKIDERHENVIRDVSQIPDDESLNASQSKVASNDADHVTTHKPSGHHVPPAVLHVAHWIYPLFPGQSPVLKDAIGAYMFPDLTDLSGKSYVGVVLSRQVDPELRIRFEQLLNEWALFKQIPPSEATQNGASEGTSLEDLIPESADYYRPSSEDLNRLKKFRPPLPAVPPPLSYQHGVTPKPWGEGQPPPAYSSLPQSQEFGPKICQNIINGTDWVSRNVLYITEKAEQIIRQGADQLQDRITPAGQPIQVGPITRSAAFAARKASSYALRVTNYSVKKFGNMTVKLAQWLAPYVKKSTIFIPQRIVSREKADHFVDQVLDIAEQSIIGVSTVFLNLEMAGTALASSLADETVRIVKYKYGQKAGSLTQDALVAATNLAKAGYNVNSFGPKAVMLNTARKSGVAFVESIRGKEHILAERQAKEKAVREHFQRLRQEREQRKLEDIGGNAEL